MIGGCSASHVSTGDDGGTIADSHIGRPDGGTVRDASTRLDAWVPPPSSDLCTADGVYLAVHGLDPTESPAYLGALNSPDFFRGIPEIIDSVGERCAGAIDAAACTTELGRLESETYQRALLSTDGDLVRARLSPEEVAAFLGPVNTPNEAALVIWHAGYDIFCGGEHLSSATDLVDGTYRVVAYRNSGGCGSPWITTRYTFRVSANGSHVLESELVVAEQADWGCVGRRPAGLMAARACNGSSPVGAFFADVARLEASAVVAFDIMIEELLALGAPEGLVAAAREAREDEVRHERSMGAIAQRYGAEPVCPEIDPPRARSRFEIALENAVEGCVRETFGALVGAHQAMRASDPVVAHAMQSVADDEIKHAELSWAIAAWLEPQLTTEERLRIERARRDAIVSLRSQAAAELDPTLIDLAGMPSGAVAVGMVDRLARDLWA